MEDESLDFDMVAASLEAEHHDVAMLLKVLANRLGSALGERLRVERGSTGLLRRKPGEVRRLSVVLGDDELIAAVHDARLECTVSHRSGGIRIRSERVSLADWLRALLASLRTEAASSQASREALEAIVIGTRDGA